jgi:hypothetical protein
MAHDQIPFFQSNPHGHSPCVTVTLTRIWACLTNMVGHCHRAYSILLKILPFSIYTSPPSVQALQSISCLSYLSCHNGSVVTWTVVSLTAAKFKPLVFSVSGSVLSYTANMVILMILQPSCHNMLIKILIKCKTLNPILNEYNSDHNSFSWYVLVYFNILLQSSPFFSKWILYMRFSIVNVGLCVSLLPRSYISMPSQTPDSSPQRHWVQSTNYWPCKNLVQWECSEEVRLSSQKICWCMEFHVNPDTVKILSNLPVISITQNAMLDDRLWIQIPST